MATTAEHNIKEREKAIQLMSNARRIIITSHTRPDGDAVGCMVGLKHAIDSGAQKAGRDCQVDLLLLSELGDNYKFILEGVEYKQLGKTVSEEEIEGGIFDTYDLFIVVDTSAVRQLPVIAPYLLKRSETQPYSVLVIDHHLGNDPIGNCRVIDTSAAAAGEVVFSLIQQADWPVSEETAKALFLAISTDTGWFRFENTHADTFRIAGELVAAGADVDTLYQRLYLSDPPERMKLVSLTMDTMELLCDNQLAVINITNDMLAESGAKRTHIENIVNEPQQIGSVIAVILLVEQIDGNTRCSLRSKRDIDVNAIANTFGGGGHARAAGVTIEKPWTDAKAMLVDAFSKELGN